MVGRPLRQSPRESARDETEVTQVTAHDAKPKFSCYERCTANVLLSIITSWPCRLKSGGAGNASAEILMPLATCLGVQWRACAKY